MRIWSDNLQHPKTSKLYMRLYEIRQPPTSLCTSSNFLVYNLQLPYKFDSHQFVMVQMVVIFKMAIMVVMVKMVEMVIMVVMAMAMVTRLSMLIIVTKVTMVEPVIMVTIHIMVDMVIIIVVVRVVIVIRTEEHPGHMRKTRQTG